MTPTEPQIIAEHPQGRLRSFLNVLDDVQQSRGPNTRWLADRRASINREYAAMMADRERWDREYRAAEQLSEKGE